MGTFRNRGGYGDRRPPGAPQAGPGGEPRPRAGNGLPAFAERRAAETKRDAEQAVEELAPGASPRVGWLYNMVAATVNDPRSNRPVQAIDLFFIPEDGGADFRATVVSLPYVLLKVPAAAEREVELALRTTFRGLVHEVTHVKLEDTSSPNHLAAGDENKHFLKVEARTTYELRQMKDDLEAQIARNNERRKRGMSSGSAFLAQGTGLALNGLATSVIDDGTGQATGYPGGRPLEGLAHIEDMREHDVAPVNRFAIDRKINVGYWYRVAPGGPGGDSEQGDEASFGLNSSNTGSISAQLMKIPELVDRADPVVLAFDIECTKAPLKFPDADTDQVMMISWMVDGKGYLGINREVVSADIENFEYSPKKEFHGDFHIYNEPNEVALLERFFLEVRLAAVRVFVTYNGDYFDWPFVEKRAAKLGISMVSQIGMETNLERGGTPQTQGRTAIHMDVFHWVNRDSYLPQGSRGLKAVTRVLLGFEPEEIPPEEMMAAAIERPHEMARYSVSDAVCTYFLYMKYVHPFMFSLCNIIPLSPDDVLRKGSGTLCEMLLMCQAREKGIVAPNKHEGSAIGKLTREGHILESETYIGGHVEALRTGIYRSDLPVRFEVDPNALDDLEASLDETLKFAVTVEAKLSMDEIVNYDEVRQSIVDALQSMRARTDLTEKPLIYHLDVSAMYPNIILTNRLQPHAIVTPEQCAACDFNGVSDCQRHMEWSWRGEYFPASRGEAEMVHRRAVQDEREEQLRALATGDPVPHDDDGARNDQQRRSRYGNPARRPARPTRPDSAPTNSAERLATTALPSFDEAPSRRNIRFRRRLKDYCRTNYRRGLDTRVETRSATVCQRENPFYVDTVRAFRDRRYEYKALLKKQKRILTAAKETGDEAKILEAEKKIVLYDSLQLAHKCILNSFYGYVMRTGARWYSMEMAGIVTNTGGLIIRRAREFIDRVGLPLELDTDGIWCMLPKSFPDVFSFKTSSGRSHNMSYICSVFNSDVFKNFTNHQYQDLKDTETLEYSTRSECSILFEVDGPYRAMVLPASLEEGKSIKKRYAVFNDDGSVAELKGFEIKRRGELKLIKEFQGEVFKKFLDGSTLKECYAAVGATCNKWLSVLTSHGDGMTDADILELLVEQNNMSKALQEYILLGQKSLAITCATRMKAFLGDGIVSNAGVATMYVVSCQPDDRQVTERAIPVQVFDISNVGLKNSLLRKWTKIADENDLDLRKLIDWEYYKGRLANAVLKIVSIPAALQAVDNPVPLIEYPPWLLKRCRALQDKRKQKTVNAFFPIKARSGDIEDGHLGKTSLSSNLAKATRNDFKAPRPGIMPKEREDPFLRELALLREPHPHIRENFAGWVKHAKKIWQAQRACRVKRYVRKRAREPGNVGPDDEDDQRALQRRRFHDDRNSIFRTKNAPLLGPGVMWQVVSITATQHPGKFSMWVLPTSLHGSVVRPGELHRITVSINRSLYVDSVTSGDPDVPGAKLIERTHPKLPRSRSGSKVYRVEIPSTQDGTCTLLDGSSADVVFGARSPLLYEAILNIGVLCLPRRYKRSGQKITEKVLASGIDLEDIDVKASETLPYLASSIGAAATPLLHQAFLYGSHSLDKTSRALYSLVVPSAKLTILVIVTSAAQARVNVSSLWANALSRAKASDHSSGSALERLPSDFQFEVRTAKTRADAWAVLSGELSRLRDADLTAASEVRGVGRRMIVLAQWPESGSLASTDYQSSTACRVLLQIPALSGFPVIHIASNAVDGKFQALGWETPAALIAMLRFIEVSDWLPNQLTISRFAAIPLGNLSVTDVHSQALDVLFGRELRNHDQVLWASEGPRPDLGGEEEEDNAIAEELAPVMEFSNPGCYRTACIDTEIADLAVAGILGSSVLHQVEGTDLTLDAEFVAQTSREDGRSDSRQAPLDEMASCGPAFHVLKGLVSRWESAAGNGKDGLAEVAKALLDHVYRWLGSERSLLYDPALAGFVRRLIRKLFWQLLSEIRRLGAGIIYASSSRIMLATPKAGAADALRYTAFVERTLKLNPLFQNLKFEPLLGIHASVLFVDRFNFGALPAPEEKHILYSDFVGEGQLNGLSRRTYGSSDIPHARMSWDIVRYLPAPVAVLWLQVIEEFIRRPMVERIRTEEQEGGDDDRGHTDAGSSEGPKSRTLRPFKPRGDGYAKEVKAFVQGLTQEMLDKVHEIREKTPSLEFPAVPTSFTQLAVSAQHGSSWFSSNRNPALEFVRTMCHVMSLDQVVTEDIGDLRRNLLRLLGVCEFAKESQFVNPALPVVLCNTICTYCNAVVDLDVARDARLWDPASVVSGGSSDAPGEMSHALPWSCEYCGHSYDTHAIELALLREAQRVVVMYQVQDLQCHRCRMVKRDNMSTHCGCSGASYELTVSRSSLDRTLRSLKGVAIFHRFELLDETLDWLIQSIASFASDE